MVAMTTSLIIIGHYQAMVGGLYKACGYMSLCGQLSCLCCIKLELVDSHQLLCGQHKSTASGIKLELVDSHQLLCGQHKSTASGIKLELVDSHQLLCGQHKSTASGIKLELVDSHQLLCGQHKSTASGSDRSLGRESVKRRIRNNRIAE